MSARQARVALVTGAGRGIGKGIASVLAARGFTVGVNDITEAAAECAAAEIAGAGHAVLPVAGDITSRAAVEAIFDRVEAEAGPLWLLVNNAGVYHSAPAAELTEAAWDQDFAVDVKGAFLCCQAAIRRMTPRGAGRIVNIASIAGLIVRAGQLSYCAAKAAVIHLSRCLAVEMAGHGITVNCVCPGMTDTEMLRQSIRERGASLESYQSLIPSGRLATPEDHAHLVAWLASEEAAHVTGQVIAVDGGQSQNLPLVR
jgi:NAD(P)-dependent dehydrogenase (short-subunit alcohol dehydrogenase family)